jgi:hypothetical protein
MARQLTPSLQLSRLFDVSIHIEPFPVLAAYGTVGLLWICRLTICRFDMSRIERNLGMAVLI